VRSDPAIRPIRIEVDNDRLILALLQTQNEAADDVLLEGLRLGSVEEKPIILATLLKRKTVRGMIGLIGQYASLDEALQRVVLASVRELHPALRECGRSEDANLRLAAMRLIALGRQGKLAYVLSDNMYNQDEAIAKGAIEAIVALARWVSTQTRWLQRGDYTLIERTEPAPPQPQAPAPRDALASYKELMSQRPEIESAVARAIDLSRGRNGPDLLRAALLLCDWPGSKTLAILQTAKHGGQTAMVRRLQQPPASEHVDAFLLAASHGQLRTHFGTVFAHINEVPVLDALLRRTHWLKDSQLQLCMHQVTRGAWWGESELLEDIARRDSDQASKIGDWLVASGAHDVVQDDRMDRLRERAANSFSARVRLLRLASQRRRGTSVALIRGFLSDPDERLARMAAREMIRRRPPDYQNILLAPMAAAAPSVRRVISRSLGHVGFEQFWQRFDQLDRNTRTQAGKAMLKILPDSSARLARRLNSGPVEQRLKALQMTQDLGLVESLRDSLATLTEHPNPKVRSKAVTVLADSTDAGGEVVLNRILSDSDPRVRANAISVLEKTHRTQFLPLLAEKARVGHHRERANSIKAMHGMKVANASASLLEMLQDARPDHRVSALWALRQMGLWKMLAEVGRVAKEDSNMRVRRYALGILKGVADHMEQEQKGKVG
jgi:HEAT repeats